MGPPGGLLGPPGGLLGVPWEPIGPSRGPKIEHWWSQIRSRCVKVTIYTFSSCILRFLLVLSEPVYSCFIVLLRVFVYFQNMFRRVLRFCTEYRFFRVIWVFVVVLLLGGSICSCFIVFLRLCTYLCKLPVFFRILDFSCFCGYFVFFTRFPYRKESCFIVVS